LDLGGWIAHSCAHITVCLEEIPMDPVDLAALPQMTITMLIAGKMDPGIGASLPFPAALRVQRAGRSRCRITIKQDVRVAGATASAP
jgi:hypothetical protein